ncbi:cyd operon YbgE family protein [Enterobacter hormaechei]
MLALFWGLINLWIHGIGFDIRRAIWQLVFLPFIGYFTTIIAIFQHWLL